MALLYARITLDGKKLNISLKRRTDVRLWNTQKQRAKGTGEKSRQTNLYLDEVHAKLFQCYQELRAENRRITPQAIKSRFLGEDRIKDYTLCDLIVYHNSKIFHKRTPPLHGTTVQARSIC